MYIYIYIYIFAYSILIRSYSQKQDTGCNVHMSGAWPGKKDKAILFHLSPLACQNVSVARL